MANLNELHVPDDADEATRWSIWEEFNLRNEAYQTAELKTRVEGIVGAFRRLSVAMKGAESGE